MRRIVGALAVAVALGLAGCGGTDWKSAHSAKANPAKPVNAAAALAAERPYIDALVVSAQANDPHGNAITIRCIAAAIVHGYGPGAFKAAGLTTTVLRRPTSSLRKLPTSEAKIAALGAAVQSCGVGSVVAPAMARSLGNADPATGSCLAHRIDTAPAARRYLILVMLERPIDRLAAHALIGLIAACVDLPATFVSAMGLDVDASTRACMVDALKRSGTTLNDYVAATIVDPDGSEDATQQLRTSLAVDINRCRPSAHTGFTVPAG